MAEVRKFVLNHGIHSGTIMSRDSRTSTYTSTYDTEKELRESFEESRRWYASIGYKIWFAEMIRPDGTKESLCVSDCDWR